MDQLRPNGIFFIGEDMSDWEKINRKLKSMNTGKTEYFHMGHFTDPVLLKKGKPMTGPTLLEGIDKPRVSKSITDKSLGKIARKY